LDSGVGREKNNYRENPVLHQLVFIPCRLDRRDARSALIDDADGWPRKVVGPLGRLGKRLVVAGKWLREAAGRHKVRFDDGVEAWVTYGPGRSEDFVPFGTAEPPHPSVTVTFNQFVGG
jgi:hypothetical protein